MGKKEKMDLNMKALISDYDPETNKIIQKNFEHILDDRNMPIKAVTEKIPEPISNTKKPVPVKQRKLELEEYRSVFLKIPKITDRKTVFISSSLRESIVGIVRRFGGERTSVSGFIENLVNHHLDTYKEELESWKKL